jgi:restriction endonuclease S subunit
MKKLKIAEIAEIHSGYQVRDKSELGKVGNLSFIQVKNLDRNLNRVSFNELEKLKMNKEMNKYSVVKGDVLFLAKGNISAFLIDDESFINDEVYIPMSHFFVLRPKKKIILQEYLWWVLNLKDTHQKLQKFLKGTMMSFISKSDFESIEIRIPSLEEQKKIVELIKLREQERILTQKLEEKKEKLLEAVFDELISGKREFTGSNFINELKKI